LKTHIFIKKIITLNN